MKTSIMENKFLLPGEHIITQSDGDIIMLTNYRIRYSDRRFGKAKIVSLLLHKLSSIEVKYTSNIILLLLGLFGLILAAYGYIENQIDFVLFGLVESAVLILLYIGSRKYVLSITSDGGKNILFHTKGMKMDDINKFINQTEHAALKIKNLIDS